MTLLTMVSLTVFAQYPTIKTINGTKVVMMTVPQAEQIDNKFAKLSDSISFLKSTLISKEKEMVFVRSEKTKVDFELQRAERRLTLSNYQIDSLNREMKRIEKLEFIEKKTRVKMYTLLGIGVATWITLVISGFSSM